MGGVIRGARSGLVAGTVYALVLAVLVGFGAALGAGPVSLLWVVLFVGWVAGAGALLGAAAAAAAGTAARVVVDRGTSGLRRVAPTAAAGVTVLLLTGLYLALDAPGPLAPEPATVVVIPTLVAVVGFATAQPKRPDT